MARTDSSRPRTPSPFAFKPGPSEDEPSEHARQAESLRRESSRHTVLVVDDDATNLALARALLEAEGFVVVTATDAFSTFDALKDTDPAVILMDIQLPGMDGWELTRRLKKNVVTSHIPVIALTAYGKQGDEERARDTGFAEFVAKPISTRQLPAIIRKYLR
jgi:two-component system, cell cycle response regulator DivK